MTPKAGWRDRSKDVATIRRFGRLGGSVKETRTPCLVCGSADTTTQLVKSTVVDKQQDVQICGQCGYVGMPDNTHDYTEATSTKNLGLAARCGTTDRTGREFGMTQLGIEVLGRSGLSVMVYGVGRSLDNVHIAKLPEVGRTVIGDIMKIRDDGEFIDISGEATDTFDIVVASEVIEHFVEPQVDFPKLFGWVASDGILICSTNVYDGSKLEPHRYIFGRGHVSYYSPESLRLIAKSNGWHVDFRLPVLGAGRPTGMRKRYVIFSRSPEVMERVSDYFGRHPFAPSEPASPKKSKKKGPVAAPPRSRWRPDRSRKGA
jgi:SAM-dependent methyltransferase